MGGPIAMKGSDNLSPEQALEMGAQPRARQRTDRVLQALKKYRERIEIITAPAAMGQDCAEQAGFTTRVVGDKKSITKGKDTEHAAKALLQERVDLLVFSGGDGTARNIYDAIGTQIPALGIPAGVKMHSGVYAISPEAAAELIALLIEGKLVDVAEAEVRDIDEEAFRKGVVKARHYGELLVPREGHFLQQVKVGGREVEELVVHEIAADIVGSMESGLLYVIGPGSTTAAIMEELGLENTLLGVDVVLNEALLAKDVNEQQLIGLAQQYTDKVRIIVTAIGGQGHILGRGNQQISSTVLTLAGLDNLVIVASKTKISELEGRPLLVDTNDPVLDQQLRGFRRVITGYHDSILYPVGWDDCDD
jgi:predicted polyphosphate/ATP-dependent NAD kinase